MNQQPTSRREKERLRRRAYIIETAMKLFSEEGYHNVSMHEIARRSEFAIATLYKFFKNKEELYRAIIMDILEKGAEVIKPILESDLDETSKLRKVIFTFSDMLMEKEDSWRLFTRESYGSSFSIKTGMDKDLSNFIDKFRLDISRVFTTGIEKGVFADKDPYYLAAALISFVEAAMLLTLNSPDEHPYPQALEKMFDIFFDRILIK
jgi:TetR/AcrR family transcriptional regulator